MGTTLKVYPFSGLLKKVKQEVPIVLINNEKPKNNVIIILKITYILYLLIVY